MADNTAEDLTPIDNEEIEETPGYKPPAQKSVQEIQQLDADDESLVKYKQQLLSGAEEVLGRKCRNFYKLFSFNTVLVGCNFGLWMSKSSRDFLRQVFPHTCRIFGAKAENIPL
jgi:hypothetical protein